MKTKNLLPNRWKLFGWILIASCLPIVTWQWFTDADFPLNLEITVPWPFGAENSENSRISDLLPNEDGTMTLQLLDELTCLALLAGLVIAGFAKVKNEDERTAQMRLEALQWAIYGNTLILTLCITFVYGMSFLSVMMYNMFTPLLIFVLRFHWLLYKESKVAGASEGKIMAL